MITIYERDAADFSGNGLGTLNPISCIVTETLNGNYEVVLTHPIDEAGKFTRIQEERIIRVPVPAGRTPRISMSAAAEALRIYKVVTDGRRLYLRAAPSQDAKGIKTYKPGTEVIVIDNETNSKWSEVETPDGKHGWMWTGNLSYVRTEVVGEAVDSIKEAANLREQPFRIYKVEPTLTGVTAYARHIFYDLMDNMVSSYKPGGSTTGAAAFIGLAGATGDEHGFTFYSDVDSTAEGVEIADKNPAEAILDDGGLIENYGGELARDWWDVYLAKRVGEETSIHIREGKNLLGIKYSVDTTNVVTRVIPKGEDEDGNPLYLDGRYRENTAEDKPVYVNNKYGVIEVKEAKVKTKGDEKRTEAECIELLEKAAKEAFEAGCDLPDVTLNVDFIDCAETEEYRQYRNLQGIHMGDTVKVIAKRVGVEVAMRMTQYSYNCLTRKYTKMTLGTIDATIEGNMINPRSIGSGAIKGSMIKLGSIGTGALADGAVNGLKIALAAIDYAHIGEAAIDQLAVNAVTAIRADIRELVAGNVTTDQLYADLAVIAAAQITAANIEKANIQWAEIENLSAEVAKIVKAEVENLEVDWAGIYEADIEWANITNLTAEIAKIAAAEIGKAKINWAQIVDVKIGTADIEDATITTAKIALGAITSALIKAGAIGTAQIADGSITEAKIVSLNADVIKTGTLSTDRLLIKGTGGLFYEINATAGGLTSTQLTEEQYKNAISGTALVARSVTADKIAAKSITANEILGQTITAAEINVANLFAADATIAALNNYILRTQTIEAIEGQLDVWASDKIRLAVESVQVGGTNLLKDSAKDVSTADYLVASYNYGNRKPDAGEAVTVRIWGELGEDREKFFIHNSSDYMWIGDLTDNGDGTYSGTFAWRLENESFPDYNVTQESQTHLSVYAYPSSGTTVSTIDRIKLEFGNKATDWSPAPEDSELEIGKLSAELSVQAGAISANAQKIETVQSTADAAQTQANANKTDLSGVTTRVETAEQTISALDGKIAAKVEKTEFDALGNEVSRQGTLIEQTAEDVLIQAGRTVGGTNYLKDSARSVSNSTYNIANYYFSDGLKPKAGETMTVRIWGTLGEGKTGFAIYNTNGYNSLGSLTDNGDGTFSATIEWKLSGGTPNYAVTEQSQTHIQVYAVPKTVTGVASTITKIKLEKGDYATDWCPHPEEFQAGSSVKITEDEVSISTKKFGVNIAGADGVTNVLTIDEDGAVFQSAEAPNIAPRYDGPAALYVDPNATSAQIAAGNYFRSLADAFAQLNFKWLAKNVTINLAAGMTEYGTVTLRGTAGGGFITIRGDSTSHAKLVGKVQIYSCMTPVVLNYLDVDAPVNARGIDVSGGYCDIANCIVTGRGTGDTVDGAANSSSVGVLAERGAHVLVSGCEMYNVYRALYTQTAAQIQASNNKGNCIVGANRTHLFVSGTAPSDSESQFNYSEIGGGKVWPGSVTIALGTPPGVSTAPTTTSFNYTSSDSYRGGWSYFRNAENTADIEDIWQGYDGKAIYGVIWFDAAAIKAAIGTKTVKQASLRLHMHTGVGRGTAVSVQLYGTNTAYDERSGQPELTKSYGTIGTTNPGEINEITIPNAVISDIVSGAIQALVLKSDDTALHKDRTYSKNYARFSGTTTATDENCPRLTVVYQ